MRSCVEDGEVPSLKVPTLIHKRGYEIRVLESETSSRSKYFYNISFLGLIERPVRTYVLGQAEVDKFSGLVKEENVRFSRLSLDQIKGFASRLQAWLDTSHGTAVKAACVSCGSSNVSEYVAGNPFCRSCLGEDPFLS